MSVATKMTAIADKIRNLLGITGSMGLDSMASNLQLVDDEVGTQEELIEQITSALEGKAAGPGGEQITPTISVNSSGLITATAGTKSATQQLTTQAAKTITPTESSQAAVAKNVYTTGVVTVGAIPSTHENVATETSAYTTELSELATQISALENALEGKAAGNGNASTAHWISLSSLPTTYGYGGDMDYASYYLEWSDDILAYLVSTNKNGDIYQVLYRGDTASHTYYNVMTHHDTIGLLHINDNTAVDYGPGYDIVAIRAPIGADYYLLPVYQTDN